MTRLAVLAAAAIVAAPNALAASPPHKGHHHHPRVVKRQIVDPCRSQVGVLPAACLVASR